MCYIARPCQKKKGRWKKRKGKEGEEGEEEILNGSKTGNS
jgi:hypothetical protein